MLSCGLQRMTHPQIDAAAIGVGGDSAGGNLASAVALKARDEALCPPLAFQLLALRRTVTPATTAQCRAAATLNSLKATATTTTTDVHYSLWRERNDVCVA